ncbi:MAG: DNA-binding protein [Nitrososphaerales archaeon]
MGEDRDLEIIRAKKMLELRKKLARRNEAPRDILLSRLVDRGDEVLLMAEKSYPEVTTKIINRLVELIRSGALRGFISGGELLWLFRSLGMDVRIETKIMVKKDGRLVSIMDKLKSSQ